jgi:hypothetical protein
VEHIYISKLSCLKNPSDGVTLPFQPNRYLTRVPVVVPWVDFNSSAAPRHYLHSGLSLPVHGLRDSIVDHVNVQLTNILGSRNSLLKQFGPCFLRPDGGLSTCVGGRLPLLGSSSSSSVSLLACILSQAWDSYSALDSLWYSP